MTGAILRRALHARPRLILGVLLALVIQTLSAGGPVGHRHAGGDTQHTHAGRILGTTNPAPRVGHDGDTGGVAIAVAHADGWHQHVVPATLAGATPRPASFAGHGTTEHLPSDPIVAPRSVDRRATHARGPPVRLA